MNTNNRSKSIDVNIVSFVNIKPVIIKEFFS
jgi:hypothetical protein